MYSERAHFQFDFSARITSYPLSHHCVRTDSCYGYFERSCLQRIRSPDFHQSGDQWLLIFANGFDGILSCFEFHVEPGSCQGNLSALPYSECYSDSKDSAFDYSSVFEHTFGISTDIGGEARCYFSSVLSSDYAHPR